MAVSEDRNRLSTEQNQDSELEQYGVWVKAGPEDVDESNVEDEAFALTDLGDDELDAAELDILGLDSEPSLEELDLEALDMDEELSEPQTVDEPSTDDTDDLDNLSLEALDEFEPRTEPVIPVTEEPQHHEELSTFNEDDLSIDLDEETDALELDASFDLEELAPPAAKPAESEEPWNVASNSEDVGKGDDGGIAIEDELPGDLDDLTLDLDSLDVDSFEEPSGADSTIEDPETTMDVLDELDLDLEDDPQVDLDAPIDLDPAMLNLDEDDLDLESLEIDDDSDTAELDLSSLPDDDDEFETIVDGGLEQSADDELPELETEEEFDLDDSFDDLTAVEDEMIAPSPAGTAESTAAASPAAADDDGSRSLLESIERELGSIRSELSDLKRELTHLRSEPSRSPEPSTEIDEDATGGFFEDEDDDEDETIALTGAELDNIMNTAEFTEETGKPTDLDELLSALPAADEPPDETENSAIQEISLEESPEDLGTIELDLSAEEESDEPEVEIGIDDEIDSLANLDIDAELADIEELEDTETPSDWELDALDLEPAETDASDLAEPEDAKSDLVELEAPPLSDTGETIPENLKGELRSVLNYMDQLLDSLPEEKIQEFAASEHFKVYKRLFEELGLEQ